MSDLGKRILGKEYEPEALRFIDVKIGKNLNKIPSEPTEYAAWVSEFKEEFLNCQEDAGLMVAENLQYVIETMQKLVSDDWFSYEVVGKAFVKGNLKAFDRVARERAFDEAVPKVVAIMNKNRDALKMITNG